MAGLHVLERTGAGYRVAFHIPVPATNNTPGVGYRSLLLLTGIGGQTVLADGAGTGADGGISTAEKTSIATGAVYEYLDTIEVPPGLTAGQLNAYLDALIADRTADVQAQLANRLGQYGRTRG